MIEKKILLKDNKQIFWLLTFIDDILDSEYALALVYRNKQKQHFIDLFSSLKTCQLKKQINWLIGV